MEKKLKKVKEWERESYLQAWKIFIPFWLVSISVIASVVMPISFIYWITEARGPFLSGFFEMTGVISLSAIILALSEVWSYSSYYYDKEEIKKAGKRMILFAKHLNPFILYFYYTPRWIFRCVSKSLRLCSGLFRLVRN